MISDSDAFQLLIAQAPPGYTRWLDTSPTGTIGKMWRVTAQALKYYGWDVLDALRRELHALEMVDRIPDWEGVLNLATTKIALYGSLAARRAQIIARRREWGTPTPAAIQAALAPVCGYSPAIIEHSRAALTAANTVSFGTTTVAGGGASTITVHIGDNAPASKAGAQLTLNFSSGHAASISVTLTAPDSQVFTPLGFFVDGSDYTYFWPAFAGGQVDGDWTLLILNQPAAPDVQLDTADLFVEGIGRSLIGADGRGAAIFEWSAVINEATVSSAYDRFVALDVTQRMNPAHCNGGLVIYQTDGVLCALSDDPNAIVDFCVAC